MFLYVLKKVYSVLYNINIKLNRRLDSTYDVGVVSAHASETGRSWFDSVGG